MKFDHPDHQNASLFLEEKSYVQPVVQLLGASTYFQWTQKLWNPEMGELACYYRKHLQNIAIRVDSSQNKSLILLHLSC